VLGLLNILFSSALRLKALLSSVAALPALPALPAMSTRCNDCARLPALDGYPRWTPAERPVYFFLRTKFMILCGTKTRRPGGACASLPSGAPTSRCTSASSS
jgi:hypothetical protein